MRTVYMRAVLFLGGLTLALAGTVRPAGAQQTTISGRVTDQATNRPLAEARLQVTGTNLTTITNQSGEYTIRGTLPGPRELRVVTLGYAPGRAVVNVAAGETATQDFALAAAPFQLEEIVTTATGQQSNLELGNKPAVIRADSVVATAPVTDLSELISGRANGVQVLPSGGTVGTGSRIRIRGSNSVSLPNDPIIYLDGIRVESGANSLSDGVDVGGQTVSRINDLNPEEIESIEILKGPSAATLYGTEAANGIIQVTTKRGHAGTPRWNVYLEQGAITEPNDFPTNFTGLTTEGDACFLELVANGLCSIDQLQSFDPLEDPGTSPFGTGYRQQYGANVSGGSDAVQYFISGEYEGERGVLDLPEFEQRRLTEQFLLTEIPDEVSHPNDLEKVSLRANVRSQLSRKVDLNISSGYVTSDLRLPQNDNNILGLLPSGYFGAGDTTNTSGYGFFLPGEIFQLRTTQDVERFTGSSNLNWRPTSWLTGRATVGLDVTSRTERRAQARGEGPAFAGQELGTVNDNRRRIFQYTVDLGATGTFQLTPWLSSRTSVGGQYFRNYFNGTDAFGEFLPAGPPSVSGGTNRDATETSTENVTVGGYVEQQFGVNERLFVAGGLRVDDNSSFGRDFDAVVYPRASVSWLVSEEPFFGEASFLTELRLRGAIGASGVQPVDTAAVRFLNPVAISNNVDNENGITLGNLGNPDLKPERSREIELGFDVGFFDSRIGLEFTYYDKLTSDALILRRLAPSIGATFARFENIGSVRNSGVEVGINALVIRSRAATWNVSLSGSYNRDNLRTLGEGVAPIVLGDQRHVPNYPLGGYWAPPILSFSDANGDGIIASSEIVVGDTAVFLGRALPNKELSLNTGLSLFNGRIRVGGQLDYRGGHKLQNLTEDFRCSAFTNCRALYDPSAPPEAQAAAVARVFDPSATIAGFVEDADFLKLRELSLTFFAPDRWARTFRAERLSLTLTGRNLATWTGYSGVDPELNGGGQLNFDTFDFLTAPPVRSYTARINLNF